MTSDTNEQPGAVPEEVESNAPDTVDPDRIFRRECLVSDGDIRVDIAKEIERTVMGNENITLQTKTVTSRGGARYTRGNRDRTVNGNYMLAAPGGSETYTGCIKVMETVTGPVLQNMSTEAESIVGGTYTNLITGGILRMCVWVDFLNWGGWLEVDVVRLEISATAIRSYINYNHATGARITLANRYVDDFQVRNENYGTVIDSQVSVNNLGTPGGGTILES